MVFARLREEATSGKVPFQSPPFGSQLKFLVCQESRFVCVLIAQFIITFACVRP